MRDSACYGHVEQPVSIRTFVPGTGTDKAGRGRLVLFHRFRGSWDDECDRDAFISLCVGQQELLGPFYGGQVFLLWEQLLDMAHSLVQNKLYCETLPCSKILRFKATRLVDGGRKCVRLEVLGLGPERVVVVEQQVLCLRIVDACRAFFARARASGLKPEESVEWTDPMLAEIESQLECD